MPVLKVAQGGLFLWWFLL